MHTPPNRNNPPPVPTGRKQSWPPFGRTTQRFFAQGEQHEATEWQDTVLVPDEESETRDKPKAGDFDVVPRQKGATFVLAVFSGCLALGVVLGVKALIGTGRKVDASATQFQQGVAREQGQLAGAPADGGAASTEKSDLAAPQEGPPSP